MISSLEQIEAFLARSRQLPVGRIFFAEPRPAPEKWVYLHPCFRYIMPLAGQKELCCASGGAAVEYLLAPGDVVVGRPGAWIDEHWNRRHEMISVVFFEQYVRAIYISHSGLPPDQQGPDVYFHTACPADAATSAAIRALLAAEPVPSAVRHLFPALQELVATLFLQEKERRTSSGGLLWSRVSGYLEYTFCNDISREDIASGVGLHPAALSKLVRQRTGLSIREYLNRLRLDYAVGLLKDESLAVEEVAMRCGFNYPSYFIRVFRESYKLSPGEFRRASEKNR